jgi:hypothetical protein
MLLMFYARCKGWRGSGVDISFCMGFLCGAFSSVGRLGVRWLDDGMWDWGMWYVVCVELDIAMEM